MLVIENAGAVVMVKTEPLDATPFAFTVTVAVPGKAIRLVATDAVNRVVLTNVVASAVSFHRMVELAVKAEPFTVKVKAALPV